MRAMLMKSYGEPDVLQPIELVAPVPNADQVTIAIHAIGLNPVEAAIRSGRFPLLKPPAILGWDVSGVVERVGAAVSRFKPGDAVFGMPAFPLAANAYAEQLSARADELALKPSALSHVDAAALPLAALTAWQGLIQLAHVEAGQRVLIHAAGGGVGHLAVQIAKARGAHVIATASAPKHDFVRGLGADQVIDYAHEDFTHAARELDLVFDLVGGDVAVRSLAVLRAAGTFVTAVEHRNTALAARTQAEGKRFVGVSVKPDGRALEAIAALAESGKLRVHVSQTLPLAEVARAHALLGHSTTGKLVLTP